MGVECVLCKSRYTEEDIARGRFWIETLICTPCYARLQGDDLSESAYARSCFGKPCLVLLSGKRLFGYNPKSVECRSLCRDRSVCRRVLSGPVEFL